MTNTACKTAREYLRVSEDRSGRARSVDEQHTDNVRAGESHGFALNGESYSDVAISASRFTTKVRGDFGRLVADIEAGRFGAEVLVLWESSRGSRKLSEWARFIEQCEAAGLLVHVTSHGRTYDPANWRDRRMLQEDGAEAESGKLSARVSRAMASNAEAGLPHGRIPYGYRRRYDEKTRRLVAQEPEPAEAAVVGELFDRLHQGHSLRAIERDFAARGILTRSGKPFTAANLRDVALRPVYAGYRVHRAGRNNGRVPSLDGAVDATWPALVSREVYHAVRARLMAPERRTSRPGRGVHLLSMIALCDVCGGKLAARFDRGREYTCHKAGHVRVDAGELDQFATAVMLAYLAREDVIEQLRATPEGDSELAQVRADLARERGELAEWRQMARDRKVSAASFAEVEPAILARIGELEARERDLSTPPALAGIITPGQDVARRWEAAEMPARREVARMLFSPAYLGTLRLGRSPVPGHPVPAEQRVTWERS